MTRFALLQHDAPAGTHWDLLVERSAGEARLATWRLAGDPTLLPIVSCEQIEDHRRAYLEIEGDIGGGRGVVRRVDDGNVMIETGPGGETLLRLAGRRLRGEFRVFSGEFAGPARDT